MFVTDGYQAPVGDSLANRGDPSPSPWHISLAYAVWYMLLGKQASIHTGDDWSMEPGGGLGQPVVAVANGVVTFAQDITSSSWRNLVVIQHREADGTIRHSRYGHLQRIDVKVGQWVIRGQQIGTVGNAGGIFYPHLHADLGKGDMLLNNPAYWPGDNYSAVVQNFYDLARVIEDEFTMAVNAIDQSVGLLKQVITLLQDYVTPAPEPPPGVTMYATDSLNVRSAPQVVANNIVGGLAKGEAVQVEDAVVAGWKHIVSGKWTGDYVSAAYLSATRPT